MFENKFKKFRENYKTSQCDDVAENDSICVIINPNQSTSSYGNPGEPSFDNDFDSFNSVTSGPVMVSKTILSSAPRKALAINTVQVQYSINFVKRFHLQPFPI